MDISSLGGSGPYRSPTAALQNAPPASAGATSSEAVTNANQAEIAAQKPLPVLGAPDVERDEDKKQTSESAGSQTELTPEEKDIVEHLKRVDREVRAHEQAHLSAAGAYATGGASYEFTTGPDGQAYAVAGQVGIDASAERTPEATIAKMQVVRAAALAPADPSPQDMAVAAAAGATESAARGELAKQQEAERRLQCIFRPVCSTVSRPWCSQVLITHSVSKTKRKEVLTGVRGCVMHTGLSELFLFMCRSAPVPSRTA